MKLDSTNITRLINVLWRYIKKNWRVLAIKTIAFVYLFGTFCCMTLYVSYNVWVATKPLGYLFILLIITGAYLLYVIINHSIVRIVIPHRILLIFDILTFIMIISLMISELWIENFYSE